MNNWDELHTAYQVAKHGTVTAAAETLGIQRATIIRHIDNLENELGTKLFQRHRRGYTPTDMGKELLQIAGLAAAEFRQLKARAKGQNELYGEFIITSLEFMAPFLMPTIQSFQQQNPTVDVKYIISENLLKLEYGQAHIAIRSGEKPDHPDYVVKPFLPIELGLFAHRDYLKKHDQPHTTDDFAEHHFVVAGVQTGFAKAPINQWLNKHLSPANIKLQSNSNIVLEQAIKAAIGIGVMMQHNAKQHPELIEIYPSNSDWQIKNWLVTHGDLHRSEKVQRFLQLLRNPK